MCFLCERAAAQRLGLIGESSVAAGLALSTDLVPTQALISNAAAQFSQQLVSAVGVMDLYLHAPGGAIEVSGGGFGTQTIQSVPITGQDQDYIRSIVNRLDSIIDLDFAFVEDAAQADTAFYYDQDIDVGGSGSGETLGLAVSGSGVWELFVNDQEVSDNWDYRLYVNLHEWGHSLGLEHPFEAGDGDTYEGSTDPWASAYPEQTVMAYRNPQTGDWPDFFTTSDLNALIEIWGAEQQVFGDGADRFIGNSYKDDVFAGKGSDVVTGDLGADRLHGGAGDDEVRGGKNSDAIFGGAGNDRLFGGRGHDTITNGRGDDQVRGGLGGDLFVLSAGNDVIEDFRLTENDRLGVSAGMSVQLEQQGNDLLVITDLGVTRLWEVSINSFDISNRLVGV